MDRETYWDRIAREIEGTTASVADWQEWDRKRRMFLRGKQIMEERRYDEACVEQYLEWANTDKWKQFPKEDYKGEKT